MSAANGVALDSVTMQTDGPVAGGGPCSGTVCVVVGPAGKYAIAISAPGFQTAHLDVVVHGVKPKGCGCSTTTTEQRTVALVPIVAIG